MRHKFKVGDIVEVVASPARLQEIGITFGISTGDWGCVVPNTPTPFVTNTGERLAVCLEMFFFPDSHFSDFPWWFGLEDVKKVGEMEVDNGAV
jgi:hypothetical protein